MRKIIVNDKVYEVNPCLHCGEDTIEYVNADEPWHDEYWSCSSCDSSYVIFNNEIAICNEDISD
jgi:hypothetical protein